MTYRRGRPRRCALLVGVIGLAVITLYYLLSFWGVGKFGAPTDIGGGLLALLGYVVTGCGVVLIVRDLVGRSPEDRR